MSKDLDKLKRFKDMLGDVNDEIFRKSLKDKIKIIEEDKIVTK